MLETYLIGIEPNNEISRYIKFLKRIIIKKFGEQPESQNIPHITLVVNIFTNKKVLKQELNKICRKTSIIKINVGKLNFFNMGNQATIFLKVNRNENLVRLQNRICEKTSYLHAGQLLKTHLNSMNVKLSKTERKISKRYGYPYKEENWIPHITLAIFKKSNLKKAINALMEYVISIKMQIKFITIFKWDKKHNRFKPSERIYLNNRI